MFKLCLGKKYFVIFSMVDKSLTQKHEEFLCFSLGVLQEKKPFRSVLTCIFYLDRLNGLDTGRKNGFTSNLPSANMMQNYVCSGANL